MPAVDMPDPQAHQAYLKARYHWERPADEGYDHALQYLDQAIRGAPSYAPALGLLARVQVGAAEYYRQLPRAALMAARDTAGRALAIDPTNCEAKVVRAEVERLVTFDWRAARDGYRAALAANPSSEFAHRGYALLLTVQRRHDDAIRAAELTRQLDPLCLAPGLVAAWTRYAARQFEEAIAESRNTLDMSAAFVPAWRVLAAAQLQLGEGREAAASLEEARRRAGDNPQVLAWLAYAYGVTGHHDAAAQAFDAIATCEAPYVSAYHVAIGLVGLGRLDAAFDSLTRAYVERDPMIACLAVEPCFDPLRGDPRYRELLELMKLGEP
jgi:tetratricopeptide (TPR) repeat protein